MLRPLRVFPSEREAELSPQTGLEGERGGGESEGWSEEESVQGRVRERGRKMAREGGRGPTPTVLREGGDVFRCLVVLRPPQEAQQLAPESPQFPLLLPWLGPGPVPQPALVVRQQSLHPLLVEAHQLVVVAGVSLPPLADDVLLWAWPETVIGYDSLKSTFIIL